MQDAGLEMLRIFFSHPAKTSLLQDYGFYELQALQKQQQQQPGSPSQTPLNMHNLNSPQQLSPQQHPFAMPNPTTLPYGQHLGLAGMNPMLQMAAAANSQFSHPHTIQSVMRNTSPIPLNTTSPYMGMNGQF